MSTALPRVDAAGFARAYQRHHQALYRYCRSIVRHDQDAQDALQSAMMRAFVALQTEQRQLDMQPWLFRIAHNESINIVRRRGRRASRWTSRSPRRPRWRTASTTARRCACCAATWPTCRRASATLWCCASSTGWGTRRSRACWR